MLAPRRFSTQQTASNVYLQAPVGGLNTMAAGNTIPPTDCIRSYNLIPAEFGLRARLGYREWCTNLNGSLDDSVRSILPFQGASDSQGRLFSCTSRGIWNVSSYGAVTSAWATSTAYSIGDGVTNSGTSYICATAGTSASSGGLPSVWAATTGYVLNARVINNGNCYICTTSGTSGASGPSGTGIGITDGSAVWSYQSSALAVSDGTVVWSHASGNTSPSRVVDFSSATGDAGWGIYTNMVTSAGHFLAYCDEVNGYYLYTGSTATWAKINSGTTQLWTPSTSYLINDRVVNGGNVYVCDTAGSSASSGGPTGTGADIVDGTTRWDYVSAAPSNAIGPSLADQHAGITLDPANFAFVVSFKNRLWFVEKNTARAWYLALNAVTGTATSFEFGGKFRQGGQLIGLWNWTIDGGSGIDDHLVGISGGGDVVIYQGTDPTSASTFGLKGVWYAGALVTGRRIASNFGGDVIILSKLGLLPLSSLVVGKIIDESQYYTSKISNLFNQYTLTYASVKGWSIRLHPEDNALIVTVPMNGEGQATNQLVMSMSTKGWFEYRDLPIYSAEVYNGKLYFGTIDGRVCTNEGYVDNVRLSDSTYTTIQWRLLTSFQNFGSGKMKQIQMIRPTILCDGGLVSYSAAARYRYDFSEIASLSSVSSIGWDNVLWDSAIWGGDFTANQNVTGATGLGVDMAVAVRGIATSRTILVGMDVLLKQGGFL